MQFPVQENIIPISVPVPMPVPAPQPVPPVVLANNFQSSTQDVDLRNVIDPRMARNLDQDMRGIAQTSVPIVSSSMDQGFQRNVQQQPNQRPAPVSAPFQSDPRQRPVDPRVKQQSQQHHPQIPVAVPHMPPQVSLPIQPSQNRLPSGIPNNASDQEKAALIMQVLQLSDEQISMLPPEQRASILVLKEQIAKSTQR